ncbi:hypothetical protein EVG20_g8043 [Dentipellis fragilis]|uniref:Uncharacterized protein n=1 Tax=Dentipellis fragilis TaxID=205917 RepID=A0A4Y9YB78_9AGAM|nr:hypothetical protein EVG20_g8043 [Dentipellis fragilis]
MALAPDVQQYLMAPSPVAGPLIEMPSGFLGSEASRFPNQQTADIALSDFCMAPPPDGGFRRQRAYCLAQGVTFMSFEACPGFGVPWHYDMFGIHAVVGSDLGMIDPLGHEHPDNPVVIGMSFSLVNGLPRVGYQLRWYHVLKEEHILPPYQFHYYEHYKRKKNAHRPQDTPKMKPEGKHYAFRFLKFTTQIQECRRSSNE